MVYVLLSHQLMMFEDPKYTYDSLVHDRPRLKKLHYNVISWTCVLNRLNLKRIKISSV